MHALVPGILMALLLSGCSAADRSASPPGGNGSSPGSFPSSLSSPSPPATTNPGRSERIDRIGRDAAFPNLGSSDYDVSHYHLDLTYDPPAGRLTGVARIEARATVGGSTFALDFRALDVQRIEVDGQAASYERTDRKLVVTPRSALSAGTNFTAVVTYSGQPQPAITAALPGIEVGWQPGREGSIVMSEPDGASTWFPGNNHPLDKATYAISVTVPAPFSAVANGRLEGIEERGNQRTFRWTMEQPMTSYLATVVTGNLREVPGGASGGVTYSSWFPAGVEPPATLLASQAAVDLLSRRLGPFPFSTYGAIAYPPGFLSGNPRTLAFLNAVALETQGRSLYSERASSATTVIHETAHQWMGNSVSLTDWSRDIWWVEGFARFAEVAFTPGASGASNNSNQLPAEPFRRSYASCQGAPAGAIPVAELFSGTAYDCGALVFYALHREVGADTFWSILRTFNERFRHANASTDDLIAVASEVSGRSLVPFFGGWLSGQLPAFPN